MNLPLTWTVNFRPSVHSPPDLMSEKELVASNPLEKPGEKSNTNGEILQNVYTKIGTVLYLSQWSKHAEFLQIARCTEAWMV